MNWYKKAKQYKNYLDIGHFYDLSRQQVDLWAFIDGDLKVHENMEAGDNHYEIWDKKIGPDDYFGRFDHKLKTVSIAVPMENQGRPIPNVILRELYDYFGSDIQIAEFN